MHHVAEVLEVLREGGGIVQRARNARNVHRVLRIVVHAHHRLHLIRQDAHEIVNVERCYPVASRSTDPLGVMQAAPGHACAQQESGSMWR